MQEERSSRQCFARDPQSDLSQTRLRMRPGPRSLMHVKVMYFNLLTVYGVPMYRHDSVLCYWPTAARTRRHGDQ